MMRKIWALFLIVVTVPMACTTSFMDFSLENKETGTSSSSPQEFSKNPLIAYCNKFHSDNHFRGLLASYYDPETQEFVKNKNWLYLMELPEHINFPSNFLQLHRFSISDNQEQYDDTPLEIQAVKHSSQVRRLVATTISRKLLDDEGGISIQDFITQHDFLLRNLDGWHGIALSVFNFNNKPVATTKVLIPPFASNPHTLLNEHNQENRLFQLHPFFNIANRADSTDKMFYNKSRDFCEEARNPIEIPTYASIQHLIPNEDLGEDEIEEYDDDSFLPSFN